jgi:hypothetical protein
MREIRIEKAGSRWLVIGDSFDSSWNDLDFAACSALSFAALMRVAEPVLGDDVPSDALTRGQHLRERLARR